MMSHQQPPLVTPSPNEAYSDTYSHHAIIMNNHSQGVVGLQAPAPLVNQLYVPETNQQQQIQQSHYDYAVETCDSSMMTDEQYHQTSSATATFRTTASFVTTSELTATVVYIVRWWWPSLRRSCSESTVP